MFLCMFWSDGFACLLLPDFASLTPKEKKGRSEKGKICKCQFIFLIAMFLELFFYVPYDLEKVVNINHIIFIHFRLVLDISHSQTSSVLKWLSDYNYTGQIFR